MERPSGDVTAYTYTPAGRLASEVRTGQVAYSRSYDYNPDGSRALVMRDDALNGSHWDVYDYDAMSGRLSAVQDVWTGEVNRFVWNPEGTLARWENNQPNSYARVFGYDEEGRLVRIERDYGNGNLQLAYVYGYNSDGARVWKQDVVSQQEYRYVCRIGCGGIPMRVYNRAMGGSSWASVEDYLPAGNALGYNQNWHYRHSGGELLMMGTTGEPSGYYPMDSNGLAVQSAMTAPCVCPVIAPVSGTVCPPLGYGGCEGGRCGEGLDLPYLNLSGTGGVPQFGFTTNHYAPTFALLPLLIAALRGCLASAGIDALYEIAKWIGCALTALAQRKPVISSCGSFPVPGLCDFVASCLTGALSGGILQKAFPKLKDLVRHIIAGLLGQFGGGVCQAISTPKPCPAPSPAPVPKRPTPQGSAGGLPRLGSITAV
ncbi:MAG: hypothetical protein KatS3mg017_0017 [Fimbriimonadales bacterium]|nr:MAG: hypothetical protein KatS3mg017_0017 [Fimbriimonadales bacterium]